MEQKSRLLCLLGALAILICLFAPTEGLTAAKPSITIHNIIDLTGAYAPISIPSEKGGKDYMAWIAEKGGLDIDGDGKGDVEVKYTWAEFGNVDARFMSAYKRFRMGTPKPTIIEMWSSPSHSLYWKHSSLRAQSKHESKSRIYSMSLFSQNVACLRESHPPIIKQDGG